MRNRSLLETRNHIWKLQEKLQSARVELFDLTIARETEKVSSLLRQHHLIYNDDGISEKRIEHGKKTALILIKLLTSRKIEFMITLENCQSILNICNEAKQYIEDPAQKGELGA
jgi:hypothetical protein